MKRGWGDSKKKLSLLRKSVSLEPKRKIQDVFVLPLTIQREDGNTVVYLVSVAGLGFCYGAAFIEIVMPSRALLSVFISEQCYLGDFLLTQTENNQC